MAAILVYSENSKEAVKLISAVHACGDEVIALAINDESLAISLAQRGVKVLAITGEGLSVRDAAITVYVLKRVIDITQISTVFLGANRYINEVAGRLARMINFACLCDIDYLQTKRERFVCTRKPSWINRVEVTETIEIDKKGSILAISPQGFTPAPKRRNGGSIQDIKINLPLTLKPGRAII